MRCEYCEEDADGYKRFLPKYRNAKGMKAHLISEPVCGTYLHVSGINYNRCSFAINYCPMCGRKLNGNKVS